MEEDKIILTGYDLTFDEIKQVSYENKKVVLSKDGMERAILARDLIVKLSNEDNQIYGLNTGVGWNKDKKVLEDYYDQYNKRLLRSHMIGIDPECTIPEVRSILLIRLNGFLSGHTGVCPNIIHYYEVFLNRGIYPIIKKRGSVGMADIGTLSAIGLAIIGEGEVFYKGERMSAKLAFELEGMKPLGLGPKDGLSIVSSNAKSAAFGSLLIIELEHFLNMYNQVFCLSLEGFNGVMDPLEEGVNRVRGFEGQIHCSQICREHLEGSYLNYPNEDRSLQDPLSFRSHCAITGAAMDAIDYFKRQLYIEINTPSDNPCLLVEEGKSYGSSNFVPLSWVLALEMTAIALTHLSKMMSNRIMGLDNPQFTKLPRFLSPNETQVIAFGTVQKTAASLDSENRMFANPSSMDFLNLAGQIEDHGSNATLSAEKVRRMVDNLYYMLGIELMHAAQAVDFRQDCCLGVTTKSLYNNYRKVVSFLDEDRNLSDDIENTYIFLKQYQYKE